MNNIEKYLSLIFCMVFSVINAQNLVPNHSFEGMIRCPIMHDSTALEHWFVPTLGSADFWNTCHVASNPSKPLPHPIFGYQNAKTGNGIAGFAVYNINPAYESREYIGIKLESALEKDTTYAVSFYINLHDSSRYLTTIGAVLLNYRITDRTSSTLHLSPAIEASGGVEKIDTASWTLIKGNYKAAGGEKYLYLGNFQNDQNSDVTFYQNVGKWFDTGTYYFIDDVSVVKDTSKIDIVGTEEIIIQNQKKLVRIVDMLGQESQSKPNAMYIYIYDDGSTEKLFRSE